MLDTLAGALAALGRCSEAVTVQTRAVDLMPERASHAERVDAILRLDAFQNKCVPGNSAPPPPASAPPPAAPQ